MDFVGKYENREKDLEIIRNKINGLQRKPSLKFSEKALGSLNTNMNIESTRNEYYDLELMDIIKNIYQTDIENFGYSPVDFYSNQNSM